VDAETVFDLSMSVFRFLVRSWLPYVLLAGVFLNTLRSRPAPASAGGATRSLLIAEILSGVMWVFAYVEGSSIPRTRVFDEGAPLLMFVALLLLPCLAFYAFWRFDELVITRGRGAVLGLSVPLLIVSLIPGIGLVSFYAGGGFFG
jgi:hypothetical protein